MQSDRIHCGEIYKIIFTYHIIWLATLFLIVILSQMLHFIAENYMWLSKQIYIYIFLSNNIRLLDPQSSLFLNMYFDISVRCEDRLMFQLLLSLISSVCY